MDLERAKIKWLQGRRIIGNHRQSVDTTSRGCKGILLLKTLLHSGRIDELYGHDFRRVVVPLGELGFFKSSVFDVLGIGIIIDLKLD
jgi:hypothetical protein